MTVSMPSWPAMHSAAAWLSPPPAAPERPRPPQPRACGCPPRPGDRRRRHQHRGGDVAETGGDRRRKAALHGILHDRTASGASHSRSTAVTSRRSSSSPVPSSTTTSVTSGSPLVSVPVLSRTTVLRRTGGRLQRGRVLEQHPHAWPESGADHDDRGWVASARASGHVMTTTVMANSSATCTLAPAASHTRKVPMPPTMATRTSQNAARSARRCPGPLEFCASCASATI